MSHEQCSNALFLIFVSCRTKSHINRMTTKTWWALHVQTLPQPWHSDILMKLPVVVLLDLSSIEVPWVSSAEMEEQHLRPDWCCRGPGSSRTNPPVCSLELSPAWHLLKGTGRTTCALVRAPTSSPPIWSKAKRDPAEPAKSPCPWGPQAPDLVWGVCYHAGSTPFWRLWED